MFEDLSLQLTATNYGSLSLSFRSHIENLISLDYVICPSQRIHLSWLIAIRRQSMLIDSTIKTVYNKSTEISPKRGMWILGGKSLQVPSINLFLEYIFNSVVWIMAFLTLGKDFNSFRFRNTKFHKSCCILLFFKFFLFCVNMGHTILRKHLYLLIYEMEL